MIPIKFRDPITESAFSVIFNEIACCFLNIHVKSRVKYNQFDDKILEVLGTDYKNYTNANWSYVFLVNVINRFMSEKNKVINWIDAPLDDNWTNERLQKNTTSIFDETTKALQMMYKSNKDQILSAMTNVSMYWKHLELSQYLQELRKIRSIFIYNNTKDEDRKYKFFSNYLSLVRALKGIEYSEYRYSTDYCSKQGIKADNLYRYEIKDKHQTHYYPQTCMIRSIGYGIFDPRIESEFYIRDIELGRLLIYDLRPIKYKVGDGKIMTKSTFMEEENRRHCKHSEVRDITNINVRTIGGETASELKRHMEILIPRIKRYKKWFYKLRRLAIEMNDNTIQTRAVLKYTDTLLTGLDYMIMMNSILPYDKLNEEVGKVLGEILFTITMSEALGIVRWYNIENDPRYEKRRTEYKEINQYYWEMDKRDDGSIEGFSLRAKYTFEPYANYKDIFDFLYSGSIFWYTKKAIDEYKCGDKHIMLHEDDDITGSYIEDFIKNKMLE